MDAVLKVWQQIEDPTPSIDEEKSCQISPESDLKRRSFMTRHGRPRRRTTTRVAMWDKFLIQKTQQFRINRDYRLTRGTHF